LQRTLRSLTKVIKKPRLLLLKKPQPQLSNSSAEDDSDDDDIVVEDLHVGPRRPKLVSDHVDQDTDDVSPYVIVRLAIARAKAMAKYREVWG
jgi:hypothetical protein